MNNCIDTEISELLPDLLHESLGGDTRRRVEAHLATCESCREELEVLRTVKAAAVFAPTIDTARVVQQILPYRMIVPGVEQPKRTRVVSWLVAAGLALAVVGGGSLVLSDHRFTTASDTITTANAPVHALALASNLDDLSDGNIVQLMDEMDRFEALPAAEPEPVIAVDSTDSL